MNVERPMPSACAAWLRVYASRSTLLASRTTTGGAAPSLTGDAWRRVFSSLRLMRRRAIRTPYTNDETYQHLGASVSRLLSRLIVAVREAARRRQSALDVEAAVELALELDQALDRLQRYLVLLAIERGEHARMVVD
jgi:hypothetical protein